MDVRQGSNRTRSRPHGKPSWPWVLAIAGMLASPAAASPAAASPSAASAAEPAASQAATSPTEAAAASASALPGLPAAIRLRLEERKSARVMDLRHRSLPLPMRHSSDTALISRALSLGYADIDTFLVPIRDVGAEALVLRFEPLTEDPRAEGIALFRHVLPEITASGVAFVAIRDNVARPETTSDRYRWLLWHTPADDWVLLNEAPDTYFERKLENLRQATQPDPTLEVAYIARRAFIAFTRGRRHDGAAMMRDALRVIDAQPADKPIPARLQVDVLQALLFQAASEDDEADLGQLIRRYVELAARLGIGVSSQPVRKFAPGVPTRVPADSYVELAFDVLEDGRVEDPVVTRTNIDSAQAARVALAMKEWRFLPAVEDGKAVRSAQTWRFLFDTLD